MIKVLFQHVVFEACLDQFFDNLIKNFGWLNWDIKIYSVGDCVKIRVSGLNYDIMLKKCVIESKEGTKMVVRSEDHPRKVWIEVEDGRISNIRGDEKAIMDIFMPNFNNN